MKWHAASDWWLLLTLPGEIFPSFRKVQKTEGREALLTNQRSQQRSYAFRLYPPTEQLRGQSRGLKDHVFTEEQNFKQLNSCHWICCLSGCGYRSLRSHWYNCRDLVQHISVHIKVLDTHSMKCCLEDHFTSQLLFTCFPYAYETLIYSAFTPYTHTE